MAENSDSLGLMTAEWKVLLRVTRRVDSRVYHWGLHWVGLKALTWVHWWVGRACTSVARRDRKKAVSRGFEKALRRVDCLDW